TKPRRDHNDQGNAMVAMSSAGMAMMAGKGAAMAVGGIAVAGIVAVPVGIAIGLGAGAYLLFKRKSMSDKQGTRQWLREVLGEARAALSDEIMHRFTDLQYALTLALDEAIERRLKQLDSHIANIDKSLAEDKAERSKRKAVLNTEREGLRSRIKQVDEVLVRIRALTPNAPGDAGDAAAEA